MAMFTKEIEYEVLAQWRNKGWAYAELYLQSKGFSHQEIEKIHKWIMLKKLENEKRVITQ